jgi:hypothetical protein
MALQDHQHLTPEFIAAYLAHEASPEEQSAVQRHLVGCAECRRDVAEASTLTADPRPRRWIAIAIPAAAAAVAFFFLLPGQGVRPGGMTTRGPGGEGVRQFSAVMPAEHTRVSVDSLVFLWRSEGGNAHYVLTVTDENGDVVWTARTSDTTLVPPRGVNLTPDSRYYWYVDALLDDARSSTTGVQEFSIRP